MCLILNSKDYTRSEKMREREYLLAGDLLPKLHFFRVFSWAFVMFDGIFHLFFFYFVAAVVVRIFQYEMPLEAND